MKILDIEMGNLEGNFEKIDLEAYLRNSPAIYKKGAQAKKIDGDFVLFSTTQRINGFDETV